MQAITFPKTLFVLKYRPNNNGSYSDWGNYSTGKQLSSGLFNSARFVKDMLKSHGVNAKLVHVEDNNKIHKEIVEFGAEIVIIEAFWVVPEKFDELKKACPNVTFVIRNHSEVPFLSSEGIAFDWTLKYLQRDNIIMSCNAPRMLEETKFLAKVSTNYDEDVIDTRVAYLPNFYPVPDTVEHQKINSSSEYLDIGCFGAIRPLKNHIEQAIAAIMLADDLGKKLRFHINGGRVEMNGAPILKNITEMFQHLPQHKLINHGWKSHEDFIVLLKSMDILTQVSFSETFNIVAADAVSVGVAVVTSKEIAWSSPCFRADPTSSADIYKKMKKAYWFKKHFPKFNPSLVGIHEYNKQSEHCWLKFLANCKD